MTTTTTQPQPSPPLPPSSQPLIPLFFYGTLQDPTFLQNLLSLPTTPMFRSATLSGYKLKLWSLYPILVPQEGSNVEGMVWDGATKAQFERLVYYEGDAYKCVETSVEVEVEREGDGAEGQVTSGDGESRAEEGRKKESRKLEGVSVFVARDPEDEEIVDGEWNLEEFQRATGW